MTPRHLDRPAAEQHHYSGFPSPLLFWSLAFAYASLMAVMLQKLVLPLIPAMHAGHGLLRDDAIAFHDHAVTIAERIHTTGWSAWSLFPEIGTANVAVLSALYALFGPDPALFIPFNAAAHATGALLIYLMGPLLWRGTAGKLGGLCAAMLFLMFPSALQWYGQNHKDAFAIAGILAMLYAWIRANVGDSSRRDFFISLSIAFGGVALLALFRPFFPIVIAAAFSASFFVLCLMSLVLRTWGKDRSSLAKSFAILLVIGLCASSVTRIDSVATANAFSELGRPSAQAGTAGTSDHPWTWKASPILPAKLDRTLERVSELREYFVQYSKSVNAGSGIDSSRLPASAAEAVAYFPRALVVGLFAPFPSSWTERVSAPRLIGAVETAIWYSLLPGVALLLFRRPSRALVAGLVFASCLLIVSSYLHPNVGTLYRQRFSVWMFVLLCGAVGWASVVVPLFIRETGAPKAGEVFPDHDPRADVPVRSAASMASAGAFVLIVTFLGYLGFMGRDLLMAVTYGMNTQLDSFFFAMMLPMFFVTFLSLPLADALTFPLVNADPVKKREGAQNVLWFACIVLGGVCFLLICFAELAARLVLPNATPADISEAARMLRWFAPVIAMSAWTVVGNTILNTLHRSRQVALAQAAVPVLAIAAILASPHDWGPVTAIGGMMAGTLANVVMVCLLVRRAGFSLMPAAGARSDFLQSVMKSYKWLMLAAFFTAAATPMNFFFAGSVGSGTVSAWALSTKMVQLFTGISSIVLAATVLPHLAHMLARRGTAGIKNQAFLLTVLGSWIGGLAAMVMFEFAEPAVSVLFSGTAVSNEQVRELATIVRIGAMQLPIVIVASIIVKMAAISGASSKVVVASVLGLAINFLANSLLVSRFGVPGIAVGALLGSVVSTAYLVFAARKLCNFDTKQMLILTGSWAVCASACVALSVQSGAALVCAALGLGGLVWAQWKVFNAAALHVTA